MVHTLIVLQLADLCMHDL